MIRLKDCENSSGSSQLSNNEDEILSTVSSKFTVTLRDEGQSYTISKNNTSFRTKGADFRREEPPINVNNTLSKHLLDMEDNINKLAAYIRMLETQMRVERKKRTKVMEKLAQMEEQRNTYKQQVQDSKQEVQLLQRVCDTMENEVTKWKTFAFEEVSRALETEDCPEIQRKKNGKHEAQPHGCSCFGKESENMTDIINSLNSSVEILKIGMANAFKNHEKPEEFLTKIKSDPSKAQAEEGNSNPALGKMKSKTKPALVPKSNGNRIHVTSKKSVLQDRKIASAKGRVKLTFIEVTYNDLIISGGTTSRAQHSKNSEAKGISTFGVPRAQSTLMHGPGGICRCKNDKIFD